MPGTILIKTSISALQSFEVALTGFKSLNESNKYFCKRHEAVILKKIQEKDYAEAIQDANDYKKQINQIDELLLKFAGDAELIEERKRLTGLLNPSIKLPTDLSKIQFVDEIKPIMERMF